MWQWQKKKYSIRPISTHYIYLSLRRWAFTSYIEDYHCLFCPDPTTLHDIITHFVRTEMASEVNWEIKHCVKAQPQESIMPTILLLFRCIKIQDHG